MNDTTQEVDYDDYFAAYARLAEHVVEAVASESERQIEICEEATHRVDNVALLLSLVAAMSYEQGVLDADGGSTGARAAD